VIAPLSIPSPDYEWQIWEINLFGLQLNIHMYALCILVGIVLAVVITSRRLTKRGAEPGIAWAQGGTTYELAWPEVAVRAESRGSLRTDASTWYLELELKVFENGELIAERSWERSTPRHLQ